MDQNRKIIEFLNDDKFQRFHNLRSEESLYGVLLKDIEPNIVLKTIIKATQKNNRPLMSIFLYYLRNMSMMTPIPDMEEDLDTTEKTGEKENATVVYRDISNMIFDQNSD